MSDKYLDELAREEKVEKYLSSLDNERRKIEEEILLTRKSKSQLKNDAKSKALEISDVVKEIMELPYFEDGEGGEITYRDKVIATAVINSINNPKLNFSDLNQLQKVVKDETTENTININISNGDDFSD